MPANTQDYQFSTMVSESKDPREFIIEFTPIESSKGSVNITKNFDELIEFFELMEE